MHQPIHRSQLRRRAGNIYYTVKRRIYRHFSPVRFAKEKSNTLLPRVVSDHHTIMLRKLAGVAMDLQYNKIQNIRIAITSINGLILHPGEIFSYWRQLGKPTKKRGFLPGVILREGKVSAGTGGGLCQLSNLLYRMTLHTSLSVVERWRHGYDVFPDSNRTQPFGSGATCSYPNIDLQIQNTTNTPFQLHVWIENNSLHGEWRSNTDSTVSYKIYEKDHLFRAEWRGCYTRHNKLFRTTIDKKTGKTLKDECIVENSAQLMYSPMLASCNSPA